MNPFLDSIFNTFYLNRISQTRFQLGFKLTPTKKSGICGFSRSGPVLGLRIWSGLVRNGQCFRLGPTTLTGQLGPRTDWFWAVDSCEKPQFSILIQTVYFLKSLHIQFLKTSATESDEPVITTTQTMNKDLTLSLLWFLMFRFQLKKY